MCEVKLLGHSVVSMIRLLVSAGTATRRCVADSANAKTAIWMKPDLSLCVDDRITELTDQV